MTRARSVLAQLVEVLDSALAATEHPAQLDKVNRELTICSLSLPLAATAQLAVPALLPVSAALFAYTTIAQLRGRLEGGRPRSGGSASTCSTSIVVLACLGTRTGAGRRDPRLVSVVRPFPHAPHRGQLEEDAARRVRQAAPLRLAGHGRPGNAGFARQAEQGRHRRRCTPARSCRWTASSSREWR